MSEKTEAAPPKGLEEAPAAFHSPEAIERPERPTWRPEALRDADLRGQDLTGVKGLLPELLAGADLTGAKLPDEIAKFPALGQVAAISSEARKIFIGLLAASVYSWLVIGTTKDVALILNTASSPLPIINTPIPIAGFYVVGGTLLAAVYGYLHFYLQRLWRTLATLPAIFPDGTALDDRSDPWLLTNLVRTQLERLSASPPPLARLESRLSIVLAWWVVPVTLFLLWARYLPAHDIGGLAWLALLLASTAFFGRHTFGLARATMRREGQPAHDRPQRPLPRILRAARHFRPGQVILSFLIPLMGILGLSLSALWQSPRSANSEVVVFSLSEPWRSLQKVDPTPAKLLNFVGIRTYADLREVNVAERPDGWDGKDWSKVKRVDLRGRNLAFADATRAFLANADLRGANLRGADLYHGDAERGAQLQGADLRGAQLQGADLSVAELQGADLRGAQLQGADLRGAQLQGADLLTAALQGADLGGAHLQGADLSGAQLHGADLKAVQLQGADLNAAQLQGADLGGAQLQGARLFGAHLQGAVLIEAQLQGTDLSRVQLRGADLRGTMIWRAQAIDTRWDFADLRGSIVQPMTGSEIESLIAMATKGVPDEEIRKTGVERLNVVFRTSERPARPAFPEVWQLKPNVMFEISDPEREPFDWGPRNWATETGYDEDLAGLLVGLACSHNASEAQTRGLARRALVTAGFVKAVEGEPDRLWPRLFAERLIIGPADCPPAKGLPEDMRRQLEQLAAQGDAAVAPPHASPPAPVE